MKRDLRCFLRAGKRSVKAFWNEICVKSFSQIKRKAPTPMLQRQKGSMLQRGDHSKRYYHSPRQILRSMMYVYQRRIHPGSIGPRTKVYILGRRDDHPSIKFFPTPIPEHAPVSPYTRIQINCMSVLAMVCLFGTRTKGYGVKLTRTLMIHPFTESTVTMNTSIYTIRMQCLGSTRKKRSVNPFIKQGTAIYHRMDRQWTADLYHVRYFI